MNGKINNKNKVLMEMCTRQNKNIEKKYLLEYNDMIRILKNVDGNIFDNTNCIFWKGYMTKCNNNKSSYVNFYLKKRKIALHRILYLNFIGSLDEKQYLKFKCANAGKCCNVNHILKVCNNENIINTQNIRNNIKITKLETSSDSKGKIVIIFDD
jgi:hypothetical protein